MFGLGFTEILVILVVALIFLGPEKLPEVARTLGRTLGELRRALDEIKDEIKFTDEPETSVIKQPKLSATTLRAEELPPSPVDTPQYSCCEDHPGEHPPKEETESK